MSWAIGKCGRAGKLASIVAAEFKHAGGAPIDSAEESAKNAMGAIVETLCASLPPETVVKVEASGSAWHEGKQAKSQSASFKFETLYDFAE
jgi:hypothetical protein